MIREATLDDVPTLVAMGLRFHAGSAYAGLLTVDPETVAVTLAGLIESESGVIFVDDEDGVLRGAILGLVVKHFVTGQPICGELSWWVDTEYRGTVGLRLLNSLEGWAQHKGACAISATEPPGNPRVGDVLERRGYALVEKTYMKAF